MKIFLLERSNQSGYYSSLIVAKTQEKALQIAKDNHFSFTLDLAGDTIKELDLINSQYISLIDFDDLNYKG